MELEDWYSIFITVLFSILVIFWTYSSPLVYDINTFIVYFFVEYLPKDGQKRLKICTRLPRLYIIVSNYNATVRIYKWLVTAWNVNNLKKSLPIFHYYILSTIELLWTQNYNYHYKTNIQQLTSFLNAHWVFKVLALLFRETAFGDTVRKSVMFSNKCAHKMLAFSAVAANVIAILLKVFIAMQERNDKWFTAVNKKTHGKPTMNIHLNHYRHSSLSGA